MSDKVQGKNTQDVLTGQVPVDLEPQCRQHRVVEHGDAGSYCNNCGKDDAGNALGRPNGGWGT